MDRSEAVSNLNTILTRWSEAREVPQRRNRVSRHAVTLIGEVLAVDRDFQALIAGISDVSIYQRSILKLSITLLLDHRIVSGTSLNVSRE